MTNETKTNRRLVGGLGAAGGGMILGSLLCYLLVPQSWHWTATPLIVEGVIGIFLLSLALVIRKEAIRKGKYNIKRTVLATLLTFCIVLATFLPAATFLPLTRATTTAPLKVYKS